MSIEQLILNSKDLLILPGGEIWGDVRHRRILEQIGQALGADTLITTICGATEGLAEDNRQHMSNNLAYLQMMCPTYEEESLYETSSVVRSNNLITATGLAPLEFAMETIRALDVFRSDILDAWYQLNKTHDSKHFFRLMSLMNK